MIVRQVFKTLLKINVYFAKETRFILYFFNGFFSVNLAVLILEEGNQVDEHFQDVIQDELRMTHKIYTQV